MKKLITLLVICYCMISIDSLSCGGAYVPYIDGPGEVELNATSVTYKHVFDDGYRNSSGGYFGTQWSLSGKGVIGYGESIIVNFNGLPAGTYTLTAKDQFGGASACYGCLTNTTYTKTISVCPRPPAPIAKPASSIKATSFVANWNAVPNATQYRVNITRVGGSTSTFTTTATSYTYTAANPLTSYSYTVQAVVCVPSAASTPAIPLTTTDFTKPVIQTGGGDSDERWVKWSSIEGANTYVVQVSERSDFATTWHSDETSETNNTFDANFCTTYYIRVRAKSLSGYLGPWSDVLKWPGGAGCRVATTLTTDNVADEDTGNVGVFPNPSNRYFTIRLPKQIAIDKVGLIVRSSNGAVADMPYSVTEGTLQVDALKAAPGLYFLAVTDGKNVLTWKVAKK